MSKPSLLVTRCLPDAVVARAQRDYDVRLHQQDDPLPQDAILAGAATADAIITAPGAPLKADLVAKLPARVKMVATFSVGFDHLDLDAAKAKGLVVSNTPDVLTDATADITLLCLLGASRRAWEGQEMLRKQEWVGWNPRQLMGWSLGGKRLGIYGMGRIGRAVADRARAFGMQILYHNRSRLSPELEKGATYYADPEALLRDSDVFSINAPASAETDNFLDARRIALLPDGAIVVNTARGTLVDDEALIAALKSGKLAAAGLDVYRGEPKLNTGYLPLQNAYLLPHLGSATVETRNAMGFCCLDNLDAFFAGKPVPNRIA